LAGYVKSRPGTGPGLLPQPAGNPVHDSYALVM
jgi:hypothetical protein